MHLDESNSIRIFKFDKYLFKTAKTLKDKWGYKSMTLYVRDVKNKKWAHVDYKFDFRKFSKKVMLEHVDHINEVPSGYFLTFENFLEKAGQKIKKASSIPLTKEMIIDLVIDIMDIDEYRGCNVPELRKELTERKVMYAEKDLVQWVTELKYDRRVHLSQISSRIFDESNAWRIIKLKNGSLIYEIHIMIGGDV